MIDERLLEHRVRTVLAETPPVPAGLLPEALDQVAVTRQRPRPIARGARLRATSIAAALVLLAGAAGAVMLRSPATQTGGPSPAPSSSPAASSTAVADTFVRPFGYTIPPQQDRSQLTLVDGSADRYGFLASDSIGTDYGDIQDPPERFGVIIANVSDPVSWRCGGPADGPDPTEIRSSPAAFLEDLRVIGGVGMTVPQPTTLDGRPALVTMIKPETSACTNRFWTAEGGNISTAVPSILHVLDVAGITVLVDAWASDENWLSNWLPTATGFVDSIHFLDGP